MTTTAKRRRRDSSDETRFRMFIIDTIAQGLALARIGARATDDPDLLASLERLDSLTYHEAVNFLKLPYMGRRGKRK